MTSVTYLSILLTMTLLAESGAEPGPQSAPAPVEDPAAADDTLSAEDLQQLRELVASLPELQRRCLAPIARGEAVADIWESETGITVEHSCSRWTEPPRRVASAVVLAPDGDNDDGENLTTRVAFADTDPPSVHEVSVGDRLGEQAVVVALGESVVLLDAGGELLAITDGSALTQWRMVWHSRFSVPATPTGGGSSAKAKKTPRKPSKRTPKPRQKKGRK